MTIQHFECNAQIFKKDELPEAVLAKIQEKFGQDFVEDANYTLWFSGEGITKETVEKTIFKIVNSALGSSANNMNESDLKMIDLGGGAAEPPPGETATEAPSLSDPGADAANAQAVADLVGGDEDSGEGDDDSDEVDREIEKELDADFGPEDDDEESEDDEESDDEESEDEESEDDEESDEDNKLDESVEQPASGEKFVFLKITMK